MASQPRKFSEKIALHNQKQAEGDAAFQQIMREVTDVTSNVSEYKIFLCSNYYIFRMFFNSRRDITITRNALVCFFDYSLEGS